ncbi:MAG: hypothetical protein HN341_15355 [Verrucomicrobia bacterium]|jgi:hypothetical protein|nr:hypothetical protein [Verrucomicrobiota bacterium]MBT7068550.1 hypothetical protein [Verrucomicrobiota bacterium]
MNGVRIELCPETGICSIVKHGALKVDLMPNEVEDVRNAGGDAASIRAIVEECDSALAASLDDEDIAAVAGKLS